MPDCPPHFRRISPALLERLWLDKSVPCRVIAKQVGLSEKGNASAPQSGESLPVTDGQLFRAKPSQRQAHRFCAPG